MCHSLTRAWVGLITVLKCKAVTNCYLVMTSTIVQQTAKTVAKITVYFVKDAVLKHS